MKFQVVLTVDERQLGSVLALLPRGVGHEISRLIEREYKNGGLRTDTNDRVINALKKNQMNTAELARALDLNPKTANSATHRLKVRKLIKRVNGVWTVL